MDISELQELQRKLRSNERHTRHASWRKDAQMLRVAQPACSAVVYFGDDVVMQCSQPDPHAPSLHSITLQWKEDGMRVPLPEKKTPVKKSTRPPAADTQ